MPPRPRQLVIRFQRMLSRHALALAAIAAAVLVAAVFAPATYDDGYITYRYADNLARGRGFVFNPGESVLGTSAPGYAALLALLATVSSPLGGSVAGAGATVSLLALVGLALAVPRLTAARAAGRGAPTFAAWVFLALMFSSRWLLELLGTETLAATALLAWAFVLAESPRQRTLAGFLAGVAVTFRADAALAAAALGIGVWVLERRLPWRLAAAAASLPIACGFWLHIDFGSPIPNTLAGKRSEMALANGTYLDAEWDWLVRSYSLGGALILLALGLVGLWFAVRVRAERRILGLAVAGSLIGLELFYRFVAVPFAPWYQVASLIGLLALVAFGLSRFREGILTVLPSHWRPLLRHGLAALLALSTLLPVAVATVQFWSEHWTVPPDPRLRVHRDAARELARISPVGSSIAAVEIGALAYFSDRRVVDLVGLVDPAILAARAAGKVADHLRSDPPDYLLDNPNFHDSFLAFFVEDPELRSSYREVARFRRPEYPFELRLLRHFPLPAL